MPGEQAMFMKSMATRTCRSYYTSKFAFSDFITSSASIQLYSDSSSSNNNATQGAFSDIMKKYLLPFKAINKKREHVYECFGLISAEKS